MAERWSRLECEAIVADYLTMLEHDLRGEAYNKAARRRALQAQLTGRSAGSIEYKHQNISAVLIGLGHAYVSGYKPAWNYQGLLEEVVHERVAATAPRLVALEDALIDRASARMPPTDWRQVFVEPPERRIVTSVQERRTRVIQGIDYTEREARNRELGERGEAFVLEVERARLAAVGRPDLVRDIEWTSKSVGDGTGYDIRSFRGETDEPLFIEVKTTHSGRAQPFLISPNEVRFSETNSAQYALYRVFEFSRAPAIFQLQGRVSEYVQLDPTQFRASFRS